MTEEIQKKSPAMIIGFAAVNIDLDLSSSDLGGGPLWPIAAVQ